MPTKGTTRHAIRIPDELWQAALTKAQERGDKLSEIIRQALADYAGPDRSAHLSTPQHTVPTEGSTERVCCGCVGGCRHAGIDPERCLRVFVPHA